LFYPSCPTVFIKKFNGLYVKGVLIYRKIKQKVREFYHSIHSPFLLTYSYTIDNTILRLGVVAQAYNPSYMADRSKRLQFKGSKDPISTTGLMH
jgi:hypothetical protein